jgi:GTP-binding protein
LMAAHIIQVLPRQPATGQAAGRRPFAIFRRATAYKRTPQPSRDRPTMTSSTAPPSPTSSPQAAGALAPPNPKIAMGWLHTAKFLTTAPELQHLPRMEVPEIAFVGRSNAGKSTCINTLTQQHRLAFASKTPGRTQSINLFSLGKQGVIDAVLADLPGYGYAAVPKEAKYRWQQVMGNYLQTRDNLKAVVLLCDPRLGLTELDEILLDVIRPRVVEGLKFLVLLTKSDKLNKTEAAKALSIVRLQAGGGDVKLFSALKRQGVEEVAQHLWDWAHPPEKPLKQPKVVPGAES